MDGPIHGVIFFETCHALYLGSDKTNVKPGAFQWCAHAQLVPVISNYALIEFGDFAKYKMDTLNARRIGLWDLLKCLIKHRFRKMKFVHEFWI